MADIPTTIHNHPQMIGQFHDDESDRDPDFGPSSLLSIQFISIKIDKDGT